MALCGGALQALEALALSEPVPEEIQDDTRPDVEGMQSASAAVNAFKVGIFLFASLPLIATSAPSDLCILLSSRQR